MAIIGKLGRKAVKTDSRTLRMAAYLTPDMPAAQPEFDWTKGIVDWGMMLNDQLGCCTISAAGHAIQVWTLNALPGAMATVPDSAILDAYEQWDGYVKGDPSTDNGGVELDVLNDWRKSGLAGHSLGAFASVNPLNLEHVRQAINFFGGVYIGLALPLSAMNQDVWDVVPDPGDGSTDPGSWGGHAVFDPKYDPNGFTCITWGAPKTMTVPFWKKYCDEVYTLLSPDWIGLQGIAQSGFNQAQLLADLEAIR